MIGTTAALLTMAAVSGGTKVAGAVMENRAAGKASKAQQQAAADSNRVARGVYDDANAMTQPYRQGGAQSMGLLSSLMVPQGQPGAYQPGMPMQQTPQIGGRPPMGVPRQPPQRATPWNQIAPPMQGPPPMQRPPMGPGPGAYGYPPQQPSPWGAVAPPNGFMPRY